MDHVSNYRTPKDSEEMDIVTRELQEKGCGAHTPSSNSPEGSEEDKPTKKHKKGKALGPKRRFWVVLVFDLPRIGHSLRLDNQFLCVEGGGGLGNLTLIGKGEVS